MKTFYEMLRLLAEEDAALGDQVGQANADQEVGGDAGQSRDFGKVKNPQDMASDQQDQSEPKNYMFFSNLKTIKEKVDAMLAMDVSQVDAMLEDGHDWAADHIATSKDDVEEVYNWLSSSVEEKA